MIPRAHGMESVLLRTDDLRNLSFETVPVQVEKTEQKENSLLVTVSADCYAHGVYVVGEHRCSDNYFDLLPGEQKTVEVYNCTQTPEIKQVR